MSLKNYPFVFFLLFSTFSFSQKIFEEQLGPCVTDYFTIELKAPIVTCESSTLLQTFCDHLDKNQLAKLQGKLALQIIVDANGDSCLFSVTNKTNIETKDLNLTTVVNQNIKWTNSEGKKICAMVVLSFEEKFITIKRLGYSFDEGWKEFNPFGTLRKTEP